MKQSQSTHKILIAFLLNMGFSVFEFIGGIFTNSVAITSDAIHDLGDAISIGIAYFLERYSWKKPDQNYTYGYMRYSVIGGLITTLILLLGSSFVIYGSIVRIIHPAPVNYEGMILLAVFGVIVNFAAAYYTHEGNSLNQRSVNLHMLEDVLGWVVVLIGAIIMYFTDIALIDPLLSISVAIFILVNAFKNFSAILDVFLEKTPREVSIEKLRAQIMQVKGVQDVHHIHVWSMDGYHNCATLHVVCKRPNSTIKEKLRVKLQEHAINHITIELETPEECCLDTECDTELRQSEHAHHHHH